MLVYKKVQSLMVFEVVLCLKNVSFDLSLLNKCHMFPASICESSSGIEKGVQLISHQFWHFETILVGGIDIFGLC